MLEDDSSSKQSFEEEIIKFVFKYVIIQIFPVEYVHMQPRHDPLLNSAAPYLAKINQKTSLQSSKNQ